MTKAESKTGKRNPMYGKRAATWKGGRKIHEGYYLVWLPDHPQAQGSGYILEHRLVMMNKLGRLLNKNELVHHKNGNKLDNSIENLELVLWGDHSRLHHKGKIIRQETKDKLKKALAGKHNSPKTEFKRSIYA